MSKLDLGLLGPSRGSVGPITTYVRNGKTIVRPRVKPANPKTLAQQHARLIIALLGILVHSFIPLIRVGFRNYASGLQTSGNIFVRRNYRNGSIQGTGINLSIDFSLLEISAGSGVNVGSPAISQGTGHTVSFSWLDNTGLSPETLASDAVAVALVNAAHPERTVAYDLGSTSRLDCSLIIAYPPLWAGDQAHAYIFTYSSDGKIVSDSQCVGTIVLA